MSVCLEPTRFERNAHSPRGGVRLRFSSAAFLIPLLIGMTGRCQVASPVEHSSSAQTNPAAEQGPTPSDSQTPPGASDLQLHTDALPQAPTAQLGSISGSVMDPTGAIIVGARVTLTTNSAAIEGRAAGGHPVETLSGSDGRFHFADVTPGAFTLTACWSNYVTQTVTVSGELHAGENAELRAITLPMPAAASQVEVTVTQQELAQIEITAEEKQRVLGFLPNFYIVYAPHPVPLNSKQKFELAWKTLLDPVTFGINGAIAGYEQAAGDFKEYGQGAAGYGKRYGAAYADGFTANMIGGAILPSLLRQDPRYYYKGTGSIKSRALYAIAMSVICKGDNGHWQFNYSAVGGELASGGISNLYYPAADRNGLGLTFQNAALGTVATAVANLFQEFLVRKLTPGLPSYSPASPQP